MLNPALQAVVLYHTRNRDLHQNSDDCDKLIVPLEPEARPFVFPDRLSITVRPYFLDLSEDFRAIVLDLFQHAAWACYGQGRGEWLTESKKAANVLRWFKQSVLFWRRKHEQGSTRYQDYTKALLFASDYKEAGKRIAIWAIADLERFIWALIRAPRKAAATEEVAQCQ